jgi:hypothetical protein
MSDPPDGFEWTGRGMEIRLIDPEWCPTGHPAMLIRRDFAHCAEHRGHNAWTCSCGQVIYRHAGEFLGELRCVSPNYGQQF